MIIKVLGPGCVNCQKIFADTEASVAEAGIDAEVMKVTDMAEILGYGVMSTPGLVINDRVVVSGRIPSKNEILELIKTAAG